MMLASATQLEQEAWHALTVLFNKAVHFIQKKNAIIRKNRTNGLFTVLRVSEPMQISCSLF